MSTKSDNFLISTLPKKKQSVNLEMVPQGSLGVFPVPVPCSLPTRSHPQRLSFLFNKVQVWHFLHAPLSASTSILSTRPPCLLLSSPMHHGPDSQRRAGQCEPSDQLILLLGPGRKEIIRTSICSSELLARSFPSLNPHPCSASGITTGHTL